MFSSRSPAIAVFALLFLFLSLVQSTNIQAGPAEREIEARVVYDSKSNTLTNKDIALEEKRATSTQDETVFGGIDQSIGQPCDEPEEDLKPRIKPRTASSTALYFQTTTPSSGPTATPSTGLSAQCVCTETGCTPESPPCCANGSCDLRAESDGGEGLRLRLTFCITIFAVVFSFLLC
ncbi:hypothetical protein GLAREA_00049 [Glarea lozoyensis ATCC 20868]|uniref:Uncharacterized protein n=1 Tax=Glarea lozoyensis (strain ATCC 20868 / MF5171) TaxID=1116229 RepID=S3DA98_GLAL2|nr:uncharacterized protein GLAREA_00049 [Glarea lozoyensis ATCC 20868]EPE28891.1 hypothetical protein GLAREA_00049 [Glarea lozoyensis ATCC 20868]